MKRRWIFVPLLVGLLVIGVTGGAVFAQGVVTGGDSPAQSFVSRVAAILGLEEAQVKDAFQQATGEMRDEAILRKLDHLVAQGRLTQEQADEYLDWYQSRPDTLPPGLPFRGLGGRGFFGGRFRSGHGLGGMKFYQEAPPTPVPDSADVISI